MRIQTMICVRRQIYSAPRDYLTCDACAKHLRHTINTHVIMRYPSLLNQGIRAPSDDDDADDDRICTPPTKHRAVHKFLLYYIM